MLIARSISRLRLMAWMSLLAWLLAPVTSPFAQTSQATRTTKRDAAISQNAELKSLYEAHQWFKLVDAARERAEQFAFKGDMTGVE